MVLARHGTLTEKRDLRDLGETSERPRFAKNSSGVRGGDLSDLHPLFLTYSRDLFSTPL